MGCVALVATLPLRRIAGRRIRLKPSSEGSNSTDMIRRGVRCVAASRRWCTGCDMGVEESAVVEIVLIAGPAGDWSVRGGRSCFGQAAGGLASNVWMFGRRVDEQQGVDEQQEGVWQTAQQECDIRGFRWSFEKGHQCKTGSDLGDLSQGEPGLVSCLRCPSRSRPAGAATSPPLAVLLCCHHALQLALGPDSLPHPDTTNPKHVHRAWSCCEQPPLHLRSAHLALTFHDS